MLRPKLYKAACAALMGSKGDLIDHDPDASQDELFEKLERMRRTRVVYSILFRHVAPHKIWQSFTFGQMGLFLKTLTGRTVTFYVDPNEAVEYLKARIEVA